jgi:hypothetical protein
MTFFDKWKKFVDNSFIINKKPVMGRHNGVMDCLALRAVSSFGFANLCQDLILLLVKCYDL